MPKPCTSCQKSTSLLCGICGDSFCKSCVQLAPPEAFEFAAKIPRELEHGVFCAPCFDLRVAPQLDLYKEILERARNVDCYFKSQGKESRLIKRTVKPVSIANCPDRSELLLKLAFAAAQAGFNALVDVELLSHKVGQGSYQSLSWRGSGVPAHASERTVVHDKSIWSDPN